MYTVFADVDVAGLRDSVAQALPGDRVNVEAQEGKIHLSGVVDSDAASDEAARLAAIYSKDVVNSLVVDPRHLPPVQLQVRIAEIDRSKLAIRHQPLQPRAKQRCDHDRTVQPAQLQHSERLEHSRHQRFPQPVLLQLWARTRCHHP